ncbi:hypothetical protein QYM36_009611 [Artemia franciscana]|uniref:Uncharacterized protein n=1 Tax=Artemia franciscana TaxID=6661 RepID=A0AA88L255_ARTSF|nr:hypothetical protein QYM36_009611 [Artemia franciscana]
MSQLSKPEQVLHEMRKYHLDILALSKIKVDWAKLFVVVCYALTNVIEIECKEEFCRTLQSVDIPRNYIKCILGDLNVVVRNDESYCPLALGRHGMGV